MKVPKNLSFWRSKTSFSKFPDVKEDRFGLKISKITENTRSTAAELGIEVLYFLKTGSHASL